MQFFLKFIRKVGLFAIFAVLLIGAYYFINKTPCDSPINYHLGSFDKKFGISREDFLADIVLAEKIWETPFGKQFFAYNSNGELPINLTYDTRQATVDKNKVLSASVDQTQVIADSVRVAFEALKSRYTAANSEYQLTVAQFEADLNAYNTEVDYWNSRGGAPKSEYDALQQKKIELQQLKTKADSQMATVNDLAAQVNAGISNYNNLVRAANSDINIINQSANKEFEQGEYVSDSTGERIDVYEFGDKTKLVRLLAHEMGHALGLDHSTNQNSIMYYLNKGTSLKLTADDVAALKKVCHIK